MPKVPLMLFHTWLEEKHFPRLDHDYDFSLDVYSEFFNGGDG